MANARRSTTEKPRYTLKAATEAAKSVRAFYGRAQAAAEIIGDAAGDRKATLLEVARKKHGFRSAAEVRRAIQVADPKRGFSKADIGELIKLAKVKEHRHLLRVTSLVRLLLVDTQEIRMELARRMICEDWTQPQVEAAVREHANNPNRGPRRGGGRPPRSPTSPKQIVDEFERLATKWRRFREHLDSSDMLTSLWGEVDESQRRKIDAVTVTLEGAGLGHGLSIRKEKDQATSADG